MNEISNDQMILSIKLCSLNELKKINEKYNNKFLRIIIVIELKIIVWGVAEG